METSPRVASLLLLVACLGLTQGAGAVSLSDAQLRSRLGQRLDLRLELQHAAGEEPSVRLAEFSEYARLGIDPPSRQMGELTVEREAVAEGREQLRVRSSNRVSEPILTLLLEVREGNTRLIREITTFIDPPAGSTLPGAEPAAAAAAPPVSPLLSALTLEPALPSLAPRAARAPEPRAQRGDATAAAAPAPARTADAPAAAKVADAPPLRRFRLDERYGAQDAAESVQIAAATARWLQREYGGEDAALPTPAAAEPVTSPRVAPPEPAAERTAPAAAAASHAPPPPWRSFLVLVMVTIGIFIYARRLRQRLMREAVAELSLEKAVA
jgi:hypothetical protein